ncbi:MAG: CPBP family intramembrane metalloprotease [Fusobacteria bacterium]|nr:CPBP family intramembrane metalloprotease [Fusobacteriota bacterium]
MILGVFIPILEEIVFRYLLIEGLLKKNSNISIIIYSSLIFALIHLQINNLLIYFIYSAFYAAYYLKYRSIYPTLICHVLNNITVLFSFIIFK